jgi:D-glycero-D-manno-heptose 1,7-bisphosphate phosphatase
MARTAFLDKDGTLVENVPYSVDPDQIRLTAGAGEGLRLLSAAGYLLVVVTNQSGVALGYFAERALRGVELRLRALLQEEGVPLHGFYYCPHHPEGCVPAYTGPCSCRKPAPGLILRAARDLAVDLPRSWLIGDILHDVEAGRCAGCRTVLIDNGNETEWRISADRTPHYMAGDLAEAARLICADSDPTPEQARHPHFGRGSAIRRKTMSVPHSTAAALPPPQMKACQRRERAAQRRSHPEGRGTHWAGPNTTTLPSAAQRRHVHASLAGSHS